MQSKIATGGVTTAQKQDAPREEDNAVKQESSQEEASVRRGKTALSGYAMYTVLFFVTVSTILIYFWKYHKSMVWDCDGVYQHFNSFVYYGKYLREILKNLWENHTLSVPMWDMSIGYGADILTTLNYYAIGDPLALLSVFASPEKAEYMYAFVVVLRLYLAGFSFLLYCRYHKNENVPSVLGALTYCFSGFALFVFSRHPAFVNPMVYFPLILIGIDKIFSGEKPWLFIWMTAVSAISNFYFFYMICVLMFLYAVVRYIKLFGGIRLKELLGWLLKFIGYFAVGIGIAAVTFLPSAMYVLNTGRMEAGNSVPALYPLSYYGRLAGDFFCVDYTSPGSRYYTVLGLVPLLLAAVFVLLVKRKKNTDLKAGFFLLTVFLLFPFFGHVLNGFSYVSNRWIWGYDMLLSYILVRVYPQLFRLDKTEKRVVLLLAVLYGAVVLLIPGHGTAHSRIAVAMLVILCAVIALCGSLKNRRWMTVFFYAMTIGGVGLNAWFLYSPQQTDYIGTFRTAGRPYKMLTTASECYPVKELGDTGDFYRYDSYGIVAHENTAMQTRMYGTDFYFSVSNGNVNRFFDELGVCIRVEQMYDNLDGRTILDRLAAVKYFVVKEGKEAFLPYSYDTKAGGNGKYAVYESGDILPFGYTYAFAVSPEQFAALTPAQKQQALLQGAVAEESSLPEAKLVFNDQEPQITVTAGEGVQVNGNTFTVSHDGAAVTLDFTGVGDSETYLMLEHVVYEGSADNFSLLVTMGSTEKKIPVYTPRHSFYSGKDDFMCNLGYNIEPQTQITLKFSKAGTYTLDDLYVVCQPVENIDGQTEKLRADVLQETEFSDNRITGSISLDSPKMLVLPMAYSDGWSAYVDGAPQKLQGVNLMYTGLELEPGEHSVELVYQTPYLKTGILISLFSICVFFSLQLLDRRIKTV
ncbi:bacterial membrane protein YfhO [Marvinbryantia formatexigens DSM 14469]|uniref:Bacterial membrane protein YfhO n=2 Tax=Marvinbryantia TaxID=248744 RepID=C6LEG8_9FIRM|nr:YfhO family protein [Marvinbryantia formatexigens]EET60951.1 bacterial membrane protein YfhO [Marvinbryantia formatexigens DSM 14469]SDF22059.1 Uncharacterized membrane protein YfhO [Marvinbryantia formatexigens]